jgi:Rab GDP dissociation inhibitor
MYRDAHTTSVVFNNPSPTPSSLFLLRQRAVMDEHYDAIILGTGITECVLSALLSVDGKKVLHMDRNQYYGGEGASLNLTQLYEKFRPGKEPPTDIGRDRDYAVDLVPKFMMANGELTKMLVHTDVTRYLEFKQIAASYVFRDGRIAKVPATEMEAVRSSLMGLFEKRRAKKFFEFIQNWRDDDPATHQTLDLDSMPMTKIFDYFGLEAGTRDFIGHAMALYLDDSYMQRPARETYDRIMLYTSSMARYGKSPYIYPLYGMGELPQGFARLSAIYGGTYMLDKKIDEIVLDSETGKFIGVRSGDETVKADMVIGDPSYFRDNVGGSGDKSKEKVRETGKLVRAICILKHPIPNTDNSDSVQLIIPQNQVGRKHDIYIAEVSGAHNVCAKGVHIAQVSTVVETSTPELELRPAMDLLGPIYDKFVSISSLEEPIGQGEEDNIFITRSLDATSHVETIVEDVRDVWRRATKGKELVLKSRSAEEGAQVQE